MEDLLAMGFEKPLVLRALQLSNYNTERALELLLNPTQLSSQKPKSEDVMVLDISQYTFSEGASACTAIAGSALKVILQSTFQRIPVSDSMLTSAIFDGVATFNQISHNKRHLSVDELGPLFSSLECKASNIQGLLSNQNPIEKLLSECRKCCDDDKYIGVIITKPPETICIVLPPINSSDDCASYYLFDSHARPQYGYDGAYLVTTKQEHKIISRLNELFQSLGSIDYEVNEAQMMYNMFEASVFQLK